MEAALQFVANMLKCGYRTQASRMFLEASEKASAVFESDDERTVLVLITTGLVYQTHMTWDDAEDWVEEAFAAALRNKDWGPKDGIVMSLQNAMDHHHFSYVSNEGRQFKTILVSLVSKSRLEDCIWSKTREHFKHPNSFPQFLVTSGPKPYSLSWTRCFRTMMRIPPHTVFLLRYIIKSYC